MKTNNDGMSKAAVLKWIITFLIPVGIYLVPVNAVFTAQIRLFLVLTVFAILTIAFEFVEFLLPSVLLPLSYVAFNIAPGEVVFAGWTTNMPLMILGAFLLANVLDEIGLLKRIAYWCILRTGSSFTGILYGIFMAGFLLSLLTSGSAYVIMAALCFGICKALQLERSPEAAAIMLTGAVSSVASMMYVYTPPTIALIIGGGTSIDPNFKITWLQVLIQNLPQLFFGIGFVFILTKLYKPEQKLNSKEYFQRAYQELGAITTIEKKGSAITILLFAFLVTSNLHQIDIAWGFMAIPWLFYFPGIRVGSKASIQNINYSMLFFIVACLSIGMVSGYLGIGRILSGILVPILAPFNTTVIVAVIWIFGTVANFILTPMAILAAFSGPIAQIAADLSINPLGILYTLMYSTDQILLPYESVPYLVFFTFGLIHMKDFVKILGLKMLLQFVFLLAIIVPYWHLIGVL